MPGKRYSRPDLHLMASLEDGDQVRVTARAHAIADQTYLISLSELRQALDDPQALLNTINLAGPLAHWRQNLSLRLSLDDVERMITYAQPAAESPTGEMQRHWLLPRVALEFSDPALAALPWVQALEEQASPHPVVHRSPVAARALARPFTLPLRVLHVPGSYTALLEQIQGQVTQHYNDRQEALAAFQYHTCGLKEIATWQRKGGWPKADILHFDALPTLDKPARLLDIERSTPGSLGWLERLANEWQTRLIILTCRVGEPGSRGSPAGDGTDKPRWACNSYLYAVQRLPG